MNGLVRSLWIGRAWSTVPMLAFVLAAAGYEPSPESLAALAAVGVAVSVAVHATVGLARALRRGDEGEVLLKVGARVPVAALRNTWRADRVELWVSVIACGGLGGWLLVQPGLAPKLLGGFGLGTVLLESVFAVQRRGSNALLAAHAALLQGDLDLAERALEPAARSTVPSVREAAEGVGAQILLRRGRAETARRQLEQGWNGALDERAALLGWLQLGTGDPSLAERWLAVPQPAGRYEQYLVALVGGLLALHRRDWNGALDRVTGPRDLPDWFARQLELLAVAALQGAGRTELARARLAPLGALASDRWLAAAVPLQWRLVEDAAARRPTPTLPATTAATMAGLPPAPPVPVDPFAAPRGETPAPTPPSRRWTGAVPVESLPLGPNRRVHRSVLGGLLLLLGPLLLLIWAVLHGSRSPDLLGLEPLLGALALGVGTLVTADQAIPRSGPGVSAITLSDGRRVGGSWFLAWGLASTAPLLGMVALLLMGISVGAFAEATWALVLAVPVAIVFLWASANRWAALRAVRSVHFDRPGVAVVRAAWAADRAVTHGAQLRVWLALARLWTGDGAGAEQQLRDIAVFQPELAGLRLWFQAARGEIDLDRALAEPEPESLGDRYRWSVTVALAALQAGRGDRVRDRAPAWKRTADALPNRFGALLRHLAERVGEPDGPVAPDPDLAWLNEVWPFVNRERT